MSSGVIMLTAAGPTGRRMAVHVRYFIWATPVIPENAMQVSSETFVFLAGIPKPLVVKESCDEIFRIIRAESLGLSSALPFGKGGDS